MIFSVLGWLLISLVVMSLIEYTLHRWAMHDKRFVEKTGVGRDALETHARLHHGRFYRPGSFGPCDDPAGKWISVDLDPGYMLLGLLPLWGGLFLFFSPTGGLCLAFVIWLHGTVWCQVHREMHEPQGRFFSTWWIYRYWRAYHQMHHLKPGSNFNVLLPGVDWLLGTYAGLDWSVRSGETDE